MTTEHIKEYAVVIFSGDSTEDSESASEIPTNWLTSDKKSCWWPHTKHVGPHIIRRTVPDKSKWELHKIRFVGYYDDIVSARRKADGFSSCEEDLMSRIEKQRVRKKTLPCIKEEQPNIKRRKTRSNEKENEYSASDESEGYIGTEKIPEPPVLKKNISSTIALDEKNNNNNSTKPVKGVPKVLSNVPLEVNVKILEGPRPANNDDDEESISKYEMETMIDTKNMETPNQYNPSLLFDDSTKTKEFLLDFEKTEKCQAETNQFHEKIIEKLGTMSFELSVISERLDRIEQGVITNKTSNIPVDNSDLLSVLPLQTVTQISELETLMSIGDIKSRMLALLIHIGGNNAKECISRMLTKIFAPSAAKECSWCGQRGNFKVSTLEIIAVVKEAVNQSYSCTDKYFEDEAKEWFRQGTQKFSRMQKNKNATIATIIELNETE